MTSILDSIDLLGIESPNEFGIAEFDDEPAVVETDPDPADPLDRKIVCPFTVIVDNQEQAPYHFLNIDPFSIVPLQTGTHLKTGDYSIPGFENRLTVERKSISDFLGSITADRPRFEREFERMAEMIRQGGFACVVVEGELSDVLRHSRDKTQVRTDSILGTVDAWSMRYGVHWRFCVGGRRGAEIQTLKLLHQFWRQEQHKIHEAKIKVTVVKEPRTAAAQGCPF